MTTMANVMTVFACDGSATAALSTNWFKMLVNKSARLVLVLFVC